MDAEPRAGARRPSGHENNVNAPAPGPLELVRSFLSLHDHEEGNPDSLPPSAESLEAWLRASGSIEARTHADRSELLWGLSVRDALKTKVYENMGAPVDEHAIRMLDDAADETGLRLSFGDPEHPLRTEAVGVRGAIGRLLATTFMAELDGTWHRLRECGDPGCWTVFYDRSKNHSTKWCSMASCGNRNKVRRFREREREGTIGDADR